MKPLRICSGSSLGHEQTNSSVCYEREAEVKQHSWRRGLVLIVVAVGTLEGGLAPVIGQQEPPREYCGFGAPQRVTIRGYDGHSMEPFLTRDGRYLMFNNLNDPKENTNLHYAERKDDLTFEYKGEIR